MRSTAAPTQQDLAATVLAVVMATDEQTRTNLATAHLREPLLAFAGVTSEFYDAANHVRRTSQQAAAVVTLMALCHSIELAMSRGPELTPALAMVANAALHALDAAVSDLYGLVGDSPSPALFPPEAARLRDEAWDFLDRHVQELREVDGDDRVRAALSLLELQPDASDDELRAAYHAKAKQWHPDLHGDASREGRASATERMGDLNTAFALLKHHGTHLAGGGSGEGGHRAGGAPTPHPPPSRRPPDQRRRPRREDECEWCGHAPARPLTFRQVTGMILVRRWANMTQTLCRSCALALGADIQNRTMMTGWWGVLAALHNVFAVLANAANLLKARALDRPSPPTGDVATPGSVPMSAPKPLFKRPGTWVGGLVICLACIVGLGSLSTAGTTTPGQNPSSPVRDDAGAPGDDLRALVGECLSFDSAGYLEEVVPCSRPNSVEVLDVVSTPADCPAWAPSYLEAPTSEFGRYDTMCLDE